MNSDQLRIDESTSRSANEMFFINVWKEILKLQSNYHYNDNLKEKFMLVTSFQNILNAVIINHINIALIFNRY